MPKVKGKEQLCRCKKKDFKSVQGFSGRTLFDRFDAIEHVVNKNVDEKYRHFLAQPVAEDDFITWYSVIYNETPRQFSTLQGEERATYGQIKNETLNHYKGVIYLLRQEDQSSDAECLEKAIKFVHDDFVYCFDGKTILGIWGMQLRDEVRESIGRVENIFKHKPLQAPIIPPPVPIDLDVPLIPDAPEELDESGVPDNSTNTDQCPEEIPVVPIPWYKRFWLWLTGKGCLKWLLWLLWLLLLLLLLFWLFRRCCHEAIAPIPYPIEDKPWIGDDPRSRGGGIYHPGDPYQPVPTPPDYQDILPPHQGVLPPIDTSEIIRNPGNPVVLGNRLNILMENEDKSIMDLAKDFKEKYPDNRYKVVYYDDVVKRMQIEVPKEERVQLKQEIPAKFAPEYELFVFDEALFEGVYTPDDPAFSDPNKSWYLKAINAPQAWDITKGYHNNRRLTIAIIDNGFSLKHPELNSKVVMPYNVWLHSAEITPHKVDHGTHVAGTALAIMDNGKGLCGIAPECAFMPVQVANEQGLMTTTSVLDGILYALYQGADVLNISLGTQYTGTLPDYVQRDLQDNHFKEEERLWNEVMKISIKHKAIVVLAAGNENMLAGVDPINRPKNFIIVSAVDKNNLEYRKTGFSNYGDYSTISAPGVGIYSCIGNNGYIAWDGTSMAAPIVSGAVALMKSLNENLTAEQIICVLTNTGLAADGNIGPVLQIDKALEKVIAGEIDDCAEPLSPCNTVVASGGEEGYIGSFAMGQQSGSFLFEYNTYNIPDKITIYEGTDTEGRILFAYEGGSVLFVHTIVEFYEPIITVEVIGCGAQTVWEFVINCPSGNNPPVTNPQPPNNRVIPGSPNQPGPNNPVQSNPNNPNNPNNRRQELEQERDRLQKRLDEIMRELQGL